MTMAPAGDRNCLILVEVLLMAAGVVSIAVVLKVSVIPLILELSTSYVLPPLRSSLLVSLRPPILFLTINFIIIIIVVSSRFHHQGRQLEVEASLRAVPDPPERVTVVADAEGGNVQEVFEDKRVVAENGGCGEGVDEAEWLVDSSSSVVEIDSKSTEIVPVSSSPAMKPPVSSRFLHRKSLSAISPGGRALMDRDYEGHETMEATWKAIMERRAMTPTTVMRHLSRSDTWDDPERQISSLESDHPPKSEKFNDRADSPATAMRHLSRRDTWDDQDRQIIPLESGHPPRGPWAKKSETFKDLRDSRQLPPLRKNQSPSLEELNRRVEAFIEKVNEDIRLQRQESLDHLQEMMSRGL